jgi:hypothetical protein
MKKHSPKPGAKRLVLTEDSRTPSSPYTIMDPGLLARIVAMSRMAGIGPWRPPHQSTYGRFKQVDS